jgi:predicted PhzF superfamily epimerase YddE/YHI9
MAELHVLRVFTDESGEFGNPLGVFVNGAEAPPGERQRIATALGFSETVFVDDAGSGEIRIFTPGTELPFAGHPCVGTAWLLARRGHELRTLRPPAGEIGLRSEAGHTYISARPEWAPAFELIELASPAAVDSLEPADFAGRLAYCWAWGDLSAGEVRARSFPGEVGIAEDEATGAAAVMLAAALGRELRIGQGRGSLLHARPLPGGRAEVGGRSELDEIRDFPI